MDDDPVLRALGDDLAREDPRLAALLSGTPPERSSPAAGWRMVALPVLAVVLLTVALLVPARVTLGVSAMLLILASPLAVLWLCTVVDRADLGGPRSP
jgi:hypothetical protein